MMDSRDYLIWSTMKIYPAISGEVPNASKEWVAQVQYEGVFYEGRGPTEFLAIGDLIHALPFILGEDKKSKVVSLGNGIKGELMALCEDGTIWSKSFGDWEKIESPGGE